jgi:hypothetical protein
MDIQENNTNSKIDLGLNPLNYSVEDEVERELL